MTKQDPDGDKFLRDFGKAVRVFRENQGLSQEELAPKCGLHRTYISEIERGQKAVTLRTLRLLAQALQVEPERLIWFSQEIDSIRKKARE